PESVAAAAIELITGDLLRVPTRVGKPLLHELSGRWSARGGSYRVLNTIDESKRLVTVLVVEHRRDAYRRLRPSSRL
ncbi:MAG: type II toxin-antitoxin system RelE/ParE family toxin, partial [Acidimicrobiales bacterium]